MAGQGEDGGKRLNVLEMMKEFRTNMDIIDDDDDDVEGSGDNENDLTQQIKEENSSADRVGYAYFTQPPMSR